MILVAGAGLTGLSAAYHLQNERDLLVVEREETPGGLCRSVTTDGFTFDLTGHLLHLRRPEIRALVHELIPEDRFERIDRKAFVYSHGVFTPYPFQVNTHGLPAPVVAECLTGFVDAVRAGEVSEKEVGQLSFKAWVLRTFGSGIARHFMIPYNEKIWLSDLDDLTCDWVSWSIPRPSVKDVIDGALGISRKAFGYNPSFLYPKEGGIRILPEALASRVKTIRYRMEIRAVDAARRTAVMSDGTELAYDQLISTMPLPRLLSMTRGLPEWIESAARRLRHTAVINLNLGIDRVVQPDKHWVYFPDKRFVFYRAGFPASFTKAAAPDGCSSIYLEVAARPGAPWDADRLVEQAREGLLSAGILEPADRIVSRVVFYIDPAYVIYDRDRRDLLPRIVAALADRGIRSAGRYGGWYYNSMEDSLAEGRALALDLLAGESRHAGAARGA